MALSVLAGSHTNADDSGCNVAARLSKAILIGANLTGTNLGRTYLGGTNFDTSFANETRFIDTDLSSALHLETIRHVGPSSIGTDTLVHSEGKIPDIFLRGCG